jgi:hypothetical protein
MSQIKNIEVHLTLEEVLRRQEVLDSSKLNPRIKSLIQELLDEVHHLIKPLVVFKMFKVKSVNTNRMILRNGEIFSDPKITGTFKNARDILIAIGTIGIGLESEVSRLFTKNEALKAFLLDGIGSAAIDCLASETCNILRSLIGELKISSPLGPGIGGVPFSEQRHIYNMIKTETSEITIMSAGMLVPRKSISMIMGVGENMPTWLKSDVCDRCKLGKTCRHRALPIKDCKSVVTINEL